MFSVLRSEWTMLWLFIKNNALTTSTIIIFSSFWSYLIWWIRSLYSIYIKLFIPYNNVIRWCFSPWAQTTNFLVIHRTAHNIAMSQQFWSNARTTGICYGFQYGFRIIHVAILLFRKSKTQTISLSNEFNVDSWLVFVWWLFFVLKNDVFPTKQHWTLLFQAVLLFWSFMEIYLQIYCIHLLSDRP